MVDETRDAFERALNEMYFSLRDFAYEAGAEILRNDHGTISRRFRLPPIERLERHLSLSCIIVPAAHFTTSAWAYIDDAGDRYLWHRKVGEQPFSTLSAVETVRQLRDGLQQLLLVNAEHVKRCGSRTKLSQPPIDPRVLN